MPEPVIALVQSAREWDNRLLLHVADFGGAKIAHRLIHENDMLQEDFSVLVVDDLATFMTGRFVEEMHDQGKAVIAVYDPSNEASRDTLRSIGCDYAISSEADAVEFLEAAAAVDETTRSVLGLKPKGAGDADALEALLHGTDEFHEPDLPAMQAGRVIAVGACGGSYGATTVAITLAHQALKSGSVILVDADVVSPMLAQRLAVLPYPNLKQAPTLDDNSPNSLHSLLVKYGTEGLEVIPGLPDADDWHTLPPTRIKQVVRALAGLYDYVVVNIGRDVEDLQYHGTARHEVTRRLISEANHVVAVTAASPTGVAKFVGWHDKVELLTSNIGVHAVVNNNQLDDFAANQLQDEIQAHTRPNSITLVPFDKSLAQAEWRGEVSKSGLLYKEILGLTAALSITPEQNPHGRPPSRKKRGVPRPFGRNKAKNNSRSGDKPAAVRTATEQEPVA